MAVVNDVSQPDVRQSATVPAFTGLYPLFGGWGTAELLFTRWRWLTHTGDSVQEWEVLSGPTRGQLLREDTSPHIEVTEGRRYDRMVIAGRPFWVNRRYRETVRTWAASSSK